VSCFAAGSRTSADARVPRVDAVCSSCGYVRTDGGWYAAGEVCLFCETPTQTELRKASIERAKIRRVISEMISESCAEGLARRLVDVVAAERARVLAAGVDVDTGVVFTGGE
jgi:hypothetical protein